jgi:hypothetical protein
VSVVDAKAAMARAYASGATPALDSVSPDGLNEIWKLGNSLFLLPAIPPDAPPELEYALRLRRDASLSGQCDGCGAAFDVESSDNMPASNVSSGLFPHRNNCLAADENIGPLLRLHYKSRRTSSLDEQLVAASRKTRAELEANLPNRTDVRSTEEVNDQFTGLLDEKIATARSRCGHLDASPVQTWNIFLWNHTWRCDECMFRFAMEHRDRPLLSPLEENTCDYCRRYSPIYLRPTISRISTFVLYGSACRRCARTFTEGNTSKEART